MPSHRADAPPRRRRDQRRRESSRGSSHRGRGSALTVPQLGIAGALGLATVVAPIYGLMGGLAPVKADLNHLAAPAAGQHDAGTGVVAQALLDPGPADGSGLLAQARPALGASASRADQRSVLPGCSGLVPPLKAANGELPASMLCTLWDGKHQLRADAAVALAKLNVAYEQTFGHPMCITAGYRSLAEQYVVKAERGSFAAQPGTSVHGLGRAVDLCDGVESFGTRTHQWMVDNAPRYGWDNPAWAQPGGDGPLEAWHWEWNCALEAGCEASGTSAAPEQQAPILAAQPAAPPSSEAAQQGSRSVALAVHPSAPPASERKGAVRVTAAGLAGSSSGGHGGGQASAGNAKASAGTG